MALQQSVITAIMGRDELYEDIILSGSSCEGFRFVSSDQDWMFVYRDIRVMFSLPTEEWCNDQKTLLLAERHTTKPGFALLRLLNTSTKTDVVASCEPYGDGCYVVSQKWRDNMTSTESYYTTHGPCSTYMIGSTEVDNAFCFKSDSLPEEAHSFVRRLYNGGWPTASTLQRIISGGCNFVAIGAKESPTEMMEWRISFSAAEKILIHAMNHVQFLCYGLLKIFFKEAVDINTEIKGLLCSYFLKTALFWEIVSGCMEWNASTFLSCFWTCFQRLLQWINNEYCPNFFIPENNMFSGKVYGTTRSRLLSYMLPLYHEGYNCLLRCPSIQNELPVIIRQPQLAILQEATPVSEKCEVERQLILEVWNSTPNFKKEPNEIMSRINELDYVIMINNVEFEQKNLQLWRNYLIQNLFISVCIGVNNCADQSRQYNMTAMPVIDATRHLLYTALYYYRCEMYRAAISRLQEAKLKLQHPHLMYPWNVDVEKYRTAGGEHKEFTQMMKEIVAWPVQLRSNVTLPELTLVHQAAANHSLDHIIIPPLVFTNFLCFLCYEHTEMVLDAQSMLQELSFLVQYDDGYHICMSDRAISWQMLGICQEMSGDNQSAYQSYCNALQQKICDLGFAPLFRIAVIINKRVMCTGQF